MATGPLSCASARRMHIAGERLVWLRRFGSVQSSASRLARVCASWSARVCASWLARVYVSGSVRVYVSGSAQVYVSGLVRVWG